MESSWKGRDRAGVESSWKGRDRGGWNRRGKDGTGGGWNPRGKGGKVLVAIFSELAWHSVIDGIGAFF